MTRARGVGEGLGALVDAGNGEESGGKADAALLFSGADGGARGDRGEGRRVLTYWTMMTSWERAAGAAVGP